MARPRKYASEADAKAAKLEKQRERREAEHALKKDPMKRKDAAVNANAYPYAPVNDETMSVIQRITATAGDVCLYSGRPLFNNGRLAAAIMVEWQNANKARLPFLEEETSVYTCPDTGKTYSHQHGEGYKWNRLYSFLRILAYFMELWRRSKIKADRHAEREQAEADKAGISVRQLRDRKYAVAKRKWEERTQAEYHRIKADAALVKRNARIDRQSKEQMEGHEDFGRF